ncbi:MAG: hypothetical protein ACD_4C00224G0008 [uncultured bacterium (gcode 4)]|uniref:Uncharacterized protein n=1 Tax=uncultured bacterium (gcode 4) TaxID=1234023 RepID=K2G921_9BACT|nr:MAG: hypothetical protein ACD_4C00224G0008 [uncultured bacterium (gcode 4)]
MKICVCSESCQNPLWKHISCKEFVNWNLNGLFSKLEEYYYKKCEQFWVEKIEWFTPVNWMPAQESLREEIFQIIYWCEKLSDLNSLNIKSRALENIKKETWEKVKSIVLWEEKDDELFLKIKDICIGLKKELWTDLFVNVAVSTHCFYSILIDC